MLKYIFFVLTLFSSISSMVSQWIECTTVVSDPLNCIIADSSGFVLAGGKDGTLIRSFDEGKNFQIIPTGKTEAFEDLIRVSDTLIVAKLSGWIYHSMDSGTTWERVSNRGRLKLLQRNGNKLYAMSEVDAEEIWSSDDFGRTWEILHIIPTTYNVSSLLIVNDSTWYVVGESGWINYTNNAGLSWEKQARGISNHLLRKILVVNDTVVAVGGDWPTGQILRTKLHNDDWKLVFETRFPSYVNITHSGLVWIGCQPDRNDYSRSIDTWEAKSSNVSKQLANFHWINKNGFGFATGDNKVFKTYNHGIIFPPTLVEEKEPENVDSIYSFYNIMGISVFEDTKGIIFKLNKKTGCCYKLINY
jgi:hypothetical protein